MNKKIHFFKEALKNYKTSGTLVPSSQYLADKMTTSVNFSSAKVIVELGPGNGVITKNILSQLNSNATLICFEINTVFYKELQKINNKQLILRNESAENIEKVLLQLGFKEACYIVSSLPLTIIPKHISFDILEKSHHILCQKGLFIQYQYSLTYYKKLKKVFGENIDLDFEIRNFPPAFIYKCSKSK